MWIVLWLCFYILSTSLWLASMLLNKGSRQFTRFARPKEDPVAGWNRLVFLHFVIFLWFFFHPLNNEGSFTISLARCEGAWSVPKCFLFSEQCRAGACLRLQVWNITHPYWKAAVRNVFCQSLQWGTSRRPLLCDQSRKQGKQLQWNLEKKKMMKEKKRMLVCK